MTTKSYYAKNKKKILSNQKKYIKANPELRAEIKHRSYIKNIEWAKKYYKRNKKKINEQCRQWRIAQKQK